MCVSGGVIVLIFYNEIARICGVKCCCSRCSVYKCESLAAFQVVKILVVHCKEKDFINVKVLHVTASNLTTQLHALESCNVYFAMTHHASAVYKTSCFAYLIISV
jgi:hypothetical protein